MRNHVLLASVCFGVLVCGCSPVASPVSGTSATEGPTSGSTVTEGPTTGTTGPESPTTGVTGTGETPTSSGGVKPDGGIGDGECDPWQQDCPDGYKCMAFAEEGEPAFTGTKCTPVAQNPGVTGDPCKVDGGWWTGIDDCDYGLACWNINHDTNEGVCAGLCTGSPDAYDCAGDLELCVFWVPGIAHVCLQGCDPLLQDCPGVQSCTPNWASGGQDWVCTADYSFEEGQEFDPCEFSNACDPGHLCYDPALALECDPEAGCCLALCDLSDPQCNGEGAVCQSFYEIIEGELPPMHADVGLCAIPG